MRRLFFASSAFLSSLAAVGCGGSHALVDPGPAPANGIQIVLDPVKNLAPGSDNEICTWTNLVADHDLYIKSVQGLQSKSGHHVLVYKTDVVQPAGLTRPCRNEDQTSFRYVGAAGGEGQSMKNTAPGSLAYIVEKGYQIVVNHHYINATPQPLDAQSVLNLYFTDPGVQVTRTGGLAIVDTNFMLPPGNPTLDIHCTMNQDVKMWQHIPHMHNYGQEITVDHTPIGGAKERLYDTAWTPEYQFNPPATLADPTAPIQFHSGDTVDVHCIWNNTTSSVLTFGIEMCVWFAQTVDDVGQGNLACDAGQWTTF
jgi:hypothetical protein